MCSVIAPKTPNLCINVQRLMCFLLFVSLSIFSLHVGQFSLHQHHLHCYLWNALQTAIAKTKCCAWRRIERKTKHIKTIEDKHCLNNKTRADSRAGRVWPACSGRSFQSLEPAADNGSVPSELRPPGAADQLTRGKEQLRKVEQDPLKIQKQIKGS